MKAIHCCAIGVALCFVFLARASAVGSTPLAAEDISDADASLAATAGREFAFDLYSHLASDNAGKNLFFSPYSLSSTLWMAAEGARGETAEELSRALRIGAPISHAVTKSASVPLNIDRFRAGMAALNARFSGATRTDLPALRDRIAALNKEFDAAKAQELASEKPRDFINGAQASYKSEKLAALLFALTRQVEEVEKLPPVDQYELRIANALWVEKAYPLEQVYLDLISRFHAPSGVFSIDFHNDAVGARKQINDWVAARTNRRINDLVSSHAIENDTSLILTNAVYFKGEWSEPFEDSGTVDADFVAPGAAKLRVATMRKRVSSAALYAAFNAEGSFFPTPLTVSSGSGRAPGGAPVYPGKGGFQILSLSYQSSGIAMFVLLPQDESGLAALEKNLTAEKFDAWIAKLQRRQTDVFMPKIRLEANSEMRKPLQAMGILRAFADPLKQGGAQFDGMCESQDPSLKLHITRVTHRTFLDVNEKGTEAAAVTSMFGAPAGIEPEDQQVPFVPTFRADRPFIFGIRDVRTGTMLFLGRVMNPTRD